MSFDEGLAQRVREDYEPLGHDVVEKKMFGGIAFMVGGHMACGVTDARLMVRVGPHAYDQALAEPHARPMDFTGRPMRGYVFVDAPGLASDEQLAKWLHICLDFVRTLPPK